MLTSKKKVAIVSQVSQNSARKGQLNLSGRRVQISLERVDVVEAAVKAELKLMEGDGQGYNQCADVSAVKTPRPGPRMKELQGHPNLAQVGPTPTFNDSHRVRRKQSEIFKTPELRPKRAREDWRRPKLSSFAKVRPKVLGWTPPCKPSK